jgi:hypothetical protein
VISVDGLGTLQATAAWTALERELDQWSDRQATLWWRDDDATDATPSLDRLLALADAAGLPVALAVIPGAATARLGQRLSQATGVAILQHGYVHMNHAAAGKKMELTADRRSHSVAAELTAGAGRLRAQFGDRVQPGLVPPWNRIAAELVPLLPAIGFTLLSCHGPRASAEPAPGLVQANTHVDPIDWRGGRGTLPEDQVIGQLTAHLGARRAGRVDAHEPTGLLTHHRDTDEAGWRLLRRLLDRLRGQRAIRWLSPADLRGRPPC